MNQVTVKTDHLFNSQSLSSLPPAQVAQLLSTLGPLAAGLNNLANADPALVGILNAAAMAGVSSSTAPGGNLMGPNLVLGSAAFPTTNSAAGGPPAPNGGGGVAGSGGGPLGGSSSGVGGTSAGGAVAGGASSSGEGQPGRGAEEKQRAGPEATAARGAEEKKELAKKKLLLNRMQFRKLHISARGNWDKIRIAVQMIAQQLELYETPDSILVGAGLDPGAPSSVKIALTREESSWIIGKVGRGRGGGGGALTREESSWWIVGKVCGTPLGAREIVLSGGA